MSKDTENQLSLTADASDKKADAVSSKAKRREAEKEKAKAAEQEKAKRREAERAKKLKKNKEKAKSKSAENAKKSKSQTRRGFKYLSGMLLAKMAFGGAAELRYNADEVNKLNVFPVPDGDTGDNMRMTIESGIAAIENMRTNDLGEVMKVLSKGMLLGARGNSGVILSQFFAGMAKGLETSTKADPKTLGNALQLGVKQAYTTVMTPTEGTILTVAREAVEYAVSRTTEKSTIRSFFADLSKEMHASLERTPELLPQLKEAGVVDSGGAGLFYIIDGFNRVLNGKKVDGQDEVARVTEGKTNAPDENIFAFGPDSEMIYGYCTEFLLRLQNKKCNPDEFDTDALKEFLMANGDSVVTFKTDSVVKVHVHTFEPEKILGYCRQFGEFLTMKIENMSVQHTAIGEGNEAEKTEATQSTQTEAPKTMGERKRYGVVAVANGPGIESLLTELGTDVVIHGGQTHNPSTSEFIEAFGKINAEHIFVFPNNGNILMAAEQAAEIYEDAEIHVIPSKSIGTGYVALSSLDFENSDADAVSLGMNEAMSRVVCGLVSPSIRDADMNGIHITSGDMIGIIGKEIVCSEPDLSSAALGMVSILLSTPDKFMLTVFRGKDISDDEDFAIRAKLKENYPDHEFYFIDGGQDIYPYIFVAE